MHWQLSRDQVLGWYLQRGQPLVGLRVRREERPLCLMQMNCVNFLSPWLLAVSMVCIGMQAGFVHCKIMLCIRLGMGDRRIACRNTIFDSSAKDKGFIIHDSGGGLPVTMLHYQPIDVPGSNHAGHGRTFLFRVLAF